MKHHRRKHAAPRLNACMLNRREHGFQRGFASGITFGDHELDGQELSFVVPRWP